jgi:tRNA pseudouridine-54 N-methylase
MTRLKLHIIKLNIAENKVFILGGHSTPPSEWISALLGTP